MMRRAAPAVVTALMLFAVPACASHGRPAGAASASQLNRHRQQLAKSMARPAAYQPLDLRFVREYSSYDSVALQIDRLAIRRGADARVSDFARGMLAVEGVHAQELAGWLRMWGKAAAPPERIVSLPSQVQILVLSRLSGSSFDRECLTLLMQDERGVLNIATEEAEGGGFGQARQLAAEAVAGSTAAIVLIRQLIAGHVA